MKEYLICIDSDGCAIDSMEIKHRRCFGPCMIDIWGLEEWKEKILSRWNEINLYSMTRGINRFLGLEMMLIEINSAYKTIDGLDAYSRWCCSTSLFSNAAVAEEVRSGNHPIFEQVLEWSEYVNHTIKKISEQIQPFSNVKGVLEQMHGSADIAIVSSANPQAVKDEWTRFGFMGYVDYVMAQDAGTKADCIRRMLGSGYAQNHILMVGDAPGDEKAAAENGVCYFPILAGRENESWELLAKEAFPRMLADEFTPKYQNELSKRFRQNLGDTRID